MAGECRLAGVVGDHGRQPELLADLEAEERLAHVAVDPGDDEIDALLRGPAELLLVRLVAQPRAW
jgi:hypothetical protein